MPLMQLSTLVLPAPFGPMSAMSSPLSTAKETRSSTTSPPNRRVSASTASSAIPPPAPTILLDVAVASPRAGRLAEIEFLDVRVAAQPLGAAVEHDAAVLHHVAVVRDRERDGGALLDQKDRDAELAADLGEAARQILDDDRREAERELVDQQQLRPAHQRAAEREHLALAAGQESADAAAQIRERRKELIDHGLQAALLGGAGAAWRRHDQVLRHREVGKHFLAFGHQHDAAPRGVMRREILEALAFEPYRAFGDARVVEAQKARDGAQRRGLAGTVGAEQRDDLAAVHGQRHALRGRDGAVIDHFELVDG